MKSLVFVHALFVALFFSGSLLAQEEENQETVMPESAQSSPLERRAGNSALSEADRQARRAEIRERFENLSDEERAAIQQRRQERSKNHQREHRILRQNRRQNSAQSGDLTNPAQTTP